VTPQRQISSSMPAALREWQRRKFEHDAIYEDFGEDVDNIDDIGPLVKTLLENAGELGDLQELWDNEFKIQKVEHRT